MHNKNQWELKPHKFKIRNKAQFFKHWKLQTAKRGSVFRSRPYASLKEMSEPNPEDPS